ncbi:unnamed protein product [Hyaloperonospora brassicae]|uniref:RxLR effector candidate protein n=1 Tax=Hyaloperonospora brassicae TaxID=162125 RepID=A0AAV0UC49_HYABA|nr:unnamed protein product [Hyaloperonospora brassicae]
MRFSYLRAVLICRVLLDKADHASGLGPTKTIALDSPQEVNEPKHLLRSPASADDQEARAFRLRIGLPEGGVSEAETIETAIDALLLLGVRLTEHDGRDTVFRGLYYDLFELKTPGASDADMIEKLRKLLASKNLLDRAVLLQLAREKIWMPKAVIETVESEFFTLIQAEKERAAFVYENQVKVLKEKGMFDCARYLEAHKDVYDAWKKAKETADKTH